MLGDAQGSRATLSSEHQMKEGRTAPDGLLFSQPRAASDIAEVTVCCSQCSNAPIKFRPNIFWIAQEPKCLQESRYEEQDCSLMVHSITATAIVVAVHLCKPDLMLLE